MDLRNEPHNAATTGACWDCGGDRDWHLAAERAGNAVLRVNPKLLIFVEGVDSYEGDTYWWGGNLEGVRRSPVRLAVANRLVYSAHTYGPAEYKQPWFNEATNRGTLRAVWRRHWAYISESGLAPLWIGEFGTPNTDADVRSQEPGSEGQWFGELVQFLHEEHSIQWTYWGINGEDRYGLLDAQYRSEPANTAKAQALAVLLPGHLDLAHPAPIVGTAMSVAIAQPAIVQPVLPVVPVVPTDSYADAAQRDVQQSLAALTQAHIVADIPSTSHPVKASESPAPEADIDRLMAAQVRQATAAAMHGNSPH